MRYGLSVTLGAVAWASASSAKDIFEPADFNVTEALIANGVILSDIPGLSGLVERSSSPCSIACHSLEVVFGRQKAIIGQHPSYWSNQQNETQPFCTFTPTTTLEVSTLVLLSRLTKCPFAVKSGGHAAFAGASSIKDGINVDLAGLRTLSLSKDKKTVAVGPSHIWYDVYQYLDPYQLAVVGGRGASVGVGGLTLGGGVSHHTNKYGLACDNVASYEVVTASGLIVTASPKSFPDLYWALRGGGNNFGIVTSFNYETISQGPMWGGFRMHLDTEIPALINAFVNTTRNAVSDPEAAHTLSFSAYEGLKMAFTELEYTTPIDKANPPAILKDYLAIPTVRDDTTNSSLVDLTPHMSADMPPGFRTSMWSASFKLDTTLIGDMIDSFFEVAPNFPAVSVSVAFQAFSVPALRAMQNKGGNALGLKPENGPFFHILFYMAWDETSDDTTMMKGAHDYIAAVTELAKERGLDNDYIYMPYASGYQSVVPGYGAENQQRLKTTSKKYDPTGVFQNLQPGWFKLDGAPFSENF
ncbi:hypothetical protein OPT61_g1349 [Boeremia exigua]|uniref:Uncharacterized protein n=1 Tax=Boeremia exigua TaxID=749465 RepID=A0ACC2IQT6_9PLEO|nr:hypothetical protein OPT61_g1349 [Boeremia exigua]